MDELGNGAPLNQLSRLSERVAALEARNGAELNNIREDLKMMRNTMHEVSNTITKAVISAEADRSVMTAHMKECAMRAGRQEWYGRVILAAIVATLGFLIKAHFFPGVY
jgi:hypothetical protein